MPLFTRQTWIMPQPASLVSLLSCYRLIPEIPVQQLQEPVSRSRSNKASLPPDQSILTTQMKQSCMSNLVNSFIHSLTHFAFYKNFQAALGKYIVSRNAVRSQSQNIPESFAVLYSPLTATSRFNTNASITIYAHMYMCVPLF